MMATQTKMIIITSDEDLIRQFSSTKSKNTRIIDLEDDQLDQSIDTNNRTLVNMALLAELSKLVCSIFSFAFVRIVLSLEFE